MQIKKSLVAAAAVATLGISGVAGLGVASAATDTSSGDGASNLIDKLATKFNLNKEDVQAVFDEERTEREAERQQRMEERLTQAVADGKLTEEQKQKILAKHEELRAAREANREELKDLPRDERRAALKDHAEELKAWAEENDIPVEYLMPAKVGPMDGHKAMGMGE